MFKSCVCVDGLSRWLLFIRRKCLRLWDVCVQCCGTSRRGAETWRRSSISTPVWSSQHLRSSACRSVACCIGPVLWVFMREVMPGHKINSEIGHSIEIQSFLMMVGHEIESKVGTQKNGTSLSVSWPSMMYLIKNDSRSILCPVLLLIPTPTVTYFTKNGPCLLLHCIIVLGCSTDWLFKSSVTSRRTGGSGPDWLF